MVISHRAGLCIFGILLLVPVHRASAHAILLSATPTERQVVPGSEISVKLRFNSRVDQKRSRLILVASDGTQNTLAIAEQSPPDTLTSQVKRLKSGSYIIRWQVLANDGHISRGDVQFRVK